MLNLISANMTEQPYHIPALFEQSLDALNIKPSGIYVDCTLGGGGHTRGILRRLAEAGGGRLLSFDQDMDAIGRAQTDETLSSAPSLTLVHGNFRYLRNFVFTARRQWTAYWQTSVSRSTISMIRSADSRSGGKKVSWTCA